MANRRMFALTIVDSDAFLDMPPSTQNLYFHLGMRADDDGFVNNPKTITRYIGSKDDDLKLLEAKKFIISFPSGVVVLKHWKINNYLQSDRITPTKYQKERSSLALSKNGAYSFVKDEDMGDKNECIQSVYGMYTQSSIGEISIGEISIGEREGVERPSHTPTQTSIVKKSYGRYNNVKLSDEQYEELQTAYPTLYQDYIDRLDRFIGKSGKSYQDHFIVIDSWILEDKKDITTNREISPGPKQKSQSEVMSDEDYEKLLNDLAGANIKKINNEEGKA